MRKRLVLLAVTVLSSVCLDAQAAKLGGSADAFTAKWGQPFRNSGGMILDFGKCPGKTALARWSLMVEQGRVVSITRNGCPGETLGPAESAREAAAFRPLDAKKHRDYKTSDGWSAEEGRSASLAKALPASAFPACKGVAAPGAFSYVLSPERRSWMLALGTCP